MSSCIKKLVCVYTDESDTENYNNLIDYLNKNVDLTENNISIIKVLAGHERDEFVGDTLFLNCKESYDSLSVKTYEMIRMCTQHRDFDFLIKVDSSIVGYGLKSNVGYSKKVRSFFYALERIKFLLENDLKFRLHKDYGGLHLTPGGNKEGYLNWAKNKNIEIDYDKIFGIHQPSLKYTGKLYFMSRKLCNQVMCTGYNKSRDYVKYLGGSEDTLISEIHAKLNQTWPSSLQDKTELNKFKNFRENKKHGRLKSLYIVNHSLKYVWYVNPKVASRTLSHQLNLKFPETYKDKKECEVVETNKYLPYEKYYDYFKFTFVRNPYDRLLSTFLDKTKKVIGTPWEIQYFAQFKDYTFEQFVGHLYENVNLSNNDVNRHLRTQMSLSNDANDLNFIGKLENLETDLNLLNNILGTHMKSIESKNKTNHDHYSSHYTNAMKKMVYEMYFEDFNFFNYKKELL